MTFLAIGIFIMFLIALKKIGDLHEQISRQERLIQYQARELKYLRGRREP